MRRIAAFALGCASLWVGQVARPATTEPVVLPRGVVLPKDVKVPNEVALAVYFPAGELKSRSYIAGLGLWAEPGKALEESRRDIATKLFPTVLPVTPGTSGHYGLLLSLHPLWSYENGQLRLDMQYRVFDPAGTLLREGSQVQNAGVNASGTLGGFRAVSYKAMQLILVDVLKELHPSPAVFPASGELGELPATRLVRHDKPVSTGTGFVLNRSGQLLTAAHVLHECLLIESSREGKSLEVKPRVSSDLLDLAVVDTGQDASTALPLRVGQTLTLGEAVTNVGYPLQGLLADTPNVTRGNVSARAGLKGSVGLFQFSAPIQPGSSGGPVVSDSGELLGITVSTLNVASLAQRGLLPQNVNFALDARYAASFLRREHIDFAEVAPRSGGSLQTANDAALAAVVKLSCYQ